MPQDALLRQRVRTLAGQLLRGLPAGSPPQRLELEQLTGRLLRELQLPATNFAFALSCLHNACWQSAFAGTPPQRRLLLLPHCLGDAPGALPRSNSPAAGELAAGVERLLARAADLGYQLHVGDSGSAVIAQIVEGKADAILSIHCLGTLETCFARVGELGAPCLAVPLLAGACGDPVPDFDAIFAALELSSAAPAASGSYLPLLRSVARIFQDPQIRRLVDPFLETNGLTAGATGLQQSVDDLAIDWLKQGGKYLRPFVTVAAYASARHGKAAFRPQADLDQLIPPSIRCLGVAIESLHKASLVHDDIEDNDDYRYGRQTLHRRHGLAAAVNIGDLLIGLGYRLVAGQSTELGGDCTSAILARLSLAHLELCRGQHAELCWQRQPELCPLPIEVLSVYDLKTSPAFEVAIYAGLRAGGVEPDAAVLRRFCAYLGEGFQVLNDLDDWRADDRNKLICGSDVLAGKPTVLRALAQQAGATADLQRLAGLSEQDLVSAVGAIYHDSGAFLQAQQMVDRLRQRALEAAIQLDHGHDLRELLQFLVHLILPSRNRQVAPASATATPAPVA